MENVIELEKDETKKRLSLKPLMEKLKDAPLVNRVPLKFWLKKIRSAPVLILVAGIFVLVYYGFFQSYSESRSEIRDLEPQIALKKATLSYELSTTNLTDLKEQLTQTEQELAVARSSLQVMSIPDPENGIDVSSEIVALGKRNNVNITGIYASSMNTGIGNGMILPYTLVVEGDMSNLLRFYSSLIGSKDLLSVMEVSSVELTQGGDSTTLDISVGVHAWPNSIPDTTLAASSDSEVN